jgi:hypothetical protein
MRAAGLLGLLLLSPLAAEGGEIVIETGALRPSILKVQSEEAVEFVNRSGRQAHVDFLGAADEHHIVPVPGRILAIFHRPGRHPYVVHLEGRRRSELRGAVDVEEPRDPRDELPVCGGVTVEGVCLER